MAINRVVPSIQSAQAEERKEFYAETPGFDVALDRGRIVGFASPPNPTAQIRVLAADTITPVVPALSIEVDDVDALYGDGAGGARRQHRQSPHEGRGRRHAVTTAHATTGRSAAPSPMTCAARA